MIGVRLHDPLLSQIDDWSLRQPDQPSRPEAIRRLVDAAFKARVVVDAAIEKMKR